MELFKTLLQKIFGGPSSPTTASNSYERPQDAVPPSENPEVATNPGSHVVAHASNSDVTEMLNRLEAQHAEKLNWKTSIVDLMKLVEMDSSFKSRKDLAHELGYAGSTEDSATMNMWLHKEVIKKISENGGKVPPELLD